MPEVSYVSIMDESFKPYYKWIVLNTNYRYGGMVPDIFIVLNLIING